MTLRIAFDMDGVLADMETPLLRYSEALFRRTPVAPTQPTAVGPTRDANPEASDSTASAGTNGRSDQVKAPIPPPGLNRLTARQQRRLWRHVEGIENFWETLEELEPGIVGRLFALSLARQWEMIFLTKRPQTAGVSAQLQTQRWLHAKGFISPSVFVVQGSRGMIASSLGLDVVADDTPENCLDVVVDSTARSILVWRDEHRPPPVATRTLGIAVVRTVAECLDLLTELDSSPPEPGHDPGPVETPGHPPESVARSLASR